MILPFFWARAISPSPTLGIFFLLRQSQPLPRPRRRLQDPEGGVRRVRPGGDGDELHKQLALRPPLRRVARPHRQETRHRNGAGRRDALPAANRETHHVESSSGLDGRLSNHQLKVMVLEIAEGLESIHRCGYIHRDIKVGLSLPSQLARQSPHEGRPYPDRRFRIRETASA